MNVTKQKNKGRKLHNEGCSQKVAAEQRGYVRVPVSVRIAEHNGIIADLPEDNLLRKILERDNMNAAYLKVKSNKGAGGVDEMSVDELLPYLRERRLSLLQQIRDGKYKPNPVRRVEIPKEEKRQIPKTGDSDGGRPGNTTGNSPSAYPNLRTAVLSIQLWFPAEAWSP
ncbi:hypothetical protein LQE88_00655 [Acidaminococcus sp. NSJ-142]|uniref:hypothetical protein n=1 Tax=Acidaminococcus hominis TaxID=2897706 RepID=UPI001E5E7E87|nr:hypothetical protein [Acidaminococcus hominis]